MPIRPEFRHLYRGATWRETRARILARAKNRCEQCGKRNAATIYVYNGRRDAKGTPIQYWLPAHGRVWRQSPSGRRGRPSERIMRGLPQKVRVVICLAHLNHVPGDDREDNLKALCQWCHLAHDRHQHRETRATTKDARRPLLHLN